MSKIETPVFGSLSGTPAELEATEFFRWFNLRQKPGDRDDGGLVYAPDAAEFHDKMALVLLRTPEGKTRWMILKVARLVLEDRRYEAAVRDLIKSFLLAVAGEDAPRLSPLADEVQFAELESPVFVRGSVTLPAQSSDVLDIILDRERGPLVLQLTRLVLWFDNLRRDDERRLVIRAYPIGSPELAEVTKTVTNQGMTIRTTVL